LAYTEQQPCKQEVTPDNEFLREV